MIAATVRQTLGDADQALAIVLLSGGSASEAQRLRDACAAEGADVLWDAPQLLPALLACRDLTQPSVALFIYVALRRCLLDLGVDRRELADYGASLLLAFGRGDRAWRTSELDENRYAYVVELESELTRCNGERQFQVLTHLGNFALWLTGIFPDYIAARRARKGGPDLDYYVAAGRSGFQRAAGHVLASRYGMTDLLSEAGERFTEMRVAMNQVSDRVMFPQAHSAERLLRQVTDAMREKE